MKGRSRATFTLLLLFAAVSVAAQTKAKSGPTSSIESRQGHHPDGPDMIGHRIVSEGNTLLCSLVEVYDESHQSSTACVIRFADGLKHTLAFNESIIAPHDAETYLECAGDKPRRCMVKVISRIADEARSQGDAAASRFIQR